MTIVREGTFNLSKGQTVEITNITGSLINVQLGTGVEMTVKGLLSTSDGNEETGLALLSGSFEVSEKASKPGIYSISVAGLEKLKLEMVGSSGKISWKELGE